MPRWLKITGAVVLGLIVGASGGAASSVLLAVVAGLGVAAVTRPTTSPPQRLPRDWAPPPMTPTPAASPEPAQHGPTDASEDVAVRRFLLRALRNGVIDAATFRALIEALETAEDDAVPTPARPEPQVAAEPPLPVTERPIPIDPDALVAELEDVGRLLQRTRPWADEWQELAARRDTLRRIAAERDIDLGELAPTASAPPVRPTAKPSPPPPPPEPKGPTVFDEMLEPVKRLWAAFTSELALHGFAYLGVFLVFVGILGFVIFAFAGVESGYRPVAELVIPAFLFGSAFMLRRRGAPFVANALSLLGGAVTPIVAFAAFADGAAFPPDLEDAPLVLALTLVSLGLAAAYAFAAHRVPESPLRYLVAPLVWVAAGVVGLAIEEGLSAAQMAFATVVIVLLGIVASRRSDHPLAAPTLVATVPGLVVGYTLFAILGWADGWPPIPALVAAAAAVLAAELLHDRVGIPWLVETVAVALAGLAAAVEWGAAPVGIGVAASYAVLTEVWGTRERRPGVLPTLMAGIGAGVAMTTVEPAVALGTAAAAAAWSNVRYLRPHDEVARQTAVVGVLALPVVAFWALTELVALEGALALSGAVVLVAAVAVRRWAPDDVLYRVGVPAATLAIALAGGTLGLASGLPADELTALAVGTGTASIGLAIGTPVTGVRVWAGGLGLTWTALLALRAAGVGFDERAAAIGMGAALAVAASIAWGRREAGHLALLGHGVGLAALVQAGTEGTQIIALGGVAFGWLAETTAHELGRSPLTDLALSWIPQDVRGRRFVLAVAPLAAMISLPFFLVWASEWTELIGDGERGRVGLLLAGTAIAYGGAARLVTGRKPIAPLLASGGVTLAGIAIAVAAPEPWPTIFAITATIVIVAVIGGELRRPIMTWFAWAVSAILTMLVGAELGVPQDGIHLLLLGWGAALLLGGLVLDDAFAGRRSPGEGIRTRAIVPPVALGAVAIPAALAFRLSDVASAAWPAAILAGVLYLVAAVLVRVGIMSTAFYGLVALGVGLALEGTAWDPVLEPGVLTLGAVALVAVSFLLQLLSPNRDPWLGWDTAPLVTAHGVAGVALVSGAGPDALAATWGSVAVLAALVAVWKANWAWLGGSVILILVAILGDPAGTWAWALGVAALLVPAAWRLKVGSLTLLTYGLATYGAVAALLDTAWWPQDRPWMYVPWMALLLMLSFVLERTSADRGPVTGWNTAPFVAAHGVAAIALITSASVGHVPSTFLGTASLSLLIAYWKRHWVWAEAGVATAIVGAATLGNGWLLLTLAIAAAAHQVAAVLVTGRARRIAQTLSIALAGWAWVVLVTWLDWNVTTARSVTAWVGGGLAVVAALVIRRIPAAAEWALPWAALGALASVDAAVAVGGDRLVVGLALAGTAALWSLAAGLAARPLAITQLRDAAAVLALLAGLALGYATEPTAAARVAGAIGGGLSAVALCVAVWVRRGGSVWIRPLVIYATVAHLSAIGVALNQLPERPLLVAALAAAGTEAVALGVVLRSPAFFYGGLPLGLGAWIAFATEALTGNPQWFTVPVGLTILGLVEVARWDLARRDIVAAEELTVLEYIGVGFLIGSSLFQTLTVSSSYGLIGIVLGSLVIMWAIGTRVRRRVYEGAVAIALSALLMIAVPLAQVIPQFRGIALWATVIGLGLLMIVIAVTLERGKALVNTTRSRIEELMEGWE